MVIESGWSAGKGSTWRMFEIFPRPTRGSRWEIFIDSYPSTVARIWAPGQYDFSAWLFASAARMFCILREHIYTRIGNLLYYCGCAARLTLFVENHEIFFRKNLFCISIINKL